jgi:ABC-type sugar transport system ATPase subunit
LVPHLTVAENIYLNREPRRVPAIGMVDFRKMNRQAEEILHDLGADVPVNRQVRELPVAAQQMVEIAQAVSQNAGLIQMDEPTSALSSKEVDALFALMRRLKEKGVPVVFISHRLEEILQVVDRIIVMRDGRRVGTLPISEASVSPFARGRSWGWRAWLAPVAQTWPVSFAAWIDFPTGRSWLMARA